MTANGPEAWFLRLVRGLLGRCQPFNSDCDISSTFINYMMVEISIWGDAG